MASITDALSDNVDVCPSHDVGWVCKVCDVAQTSDKTYCQVCLQAKPLDKHGIPQLFKEYTFHFNGVIPRNLIHPSHAVEWRMAERHGATCSTTFDPYTVNILIYRPGYERSEKCRECVLMHKNIPCVPISWMLDSLLHTRQIHPSLYALVSIPEVATATVKSSQLPHHEHPFYVLNEKEYAIPTSFAVRKTKRLAVNTRNGMTIRLSETPNLPVYFTVEPLQHTVRDVFEIVLETIMERKRGKSGRLQGNRAMGANNTVDNGGVGSSSGTQGRNSTHIDVACDDEDDAGADEDEVEAYTAGQNKGIELLASQKARNRVDTMLFSGITVALSPSVQSSETITQVLALCGATVVQVDNPTPDALQSARITHVIFARQDKKAPIMISAAYLISMKKTRIQLVSQGWLEDCLILGELIPVGTMYKPTPKLMETLLSKYNRQTH